jgi:hypothetical protein
MKMNKKIIPSVYREPGSVDFMEYVRFMHQNGENNICVYIKTTDWVRYDALKSVMRKFGASNYFKQPLEPSKGVAWFNIFDYSVGLIDSIDIEDGLELTLTKFSLEQSLENLSLDTSNKVESIPDSIAKKYRWSDRVDGKGISTFRIGTEATVGKRIYSMLDTLAGRALKMGKDVGADVVHVNRIEINQFEYKLETALILDFYKR